MKVTFLAKEYPPNTYGGAGVHLSHLSNYLSRIMEVEVRCFGDQDEKKPHMKVKGYKSYLPEPDSLSHHRFEPALETFAANLAMVRDPMDTDVIHTHTWYVGMAGFLSRMIYYQPLVVTCHSLEPLRPWKEEQLGRGYIVSSWSEKLVLERADKIVAVSQTMKQDLLKFFNVKEENIAVIHNGIDLEKWDRLATRGIHEKLGLKEDYILFVGRTTKQKGLIYLIQAADDLPPDIKIVICTSGADTKQYADEVAKIAKTKKNIVYIDKMLDPQDYLELYSHCRVFVCPSVYEPFGIINLEAMACRRPVVASSVGGIKEVVVQDETGILIDPAEPRAIAQAVNNLLKNRELAEEMGQKGRKRVEESFSWAVIAHKTKRLYVDLVGQWWKDEKRHFLSHPDLDQY